MNHEPQKPRMSASEAGRKGGQSKSAAKLAACRKNGFQPSAPAQPEPQQETAPGRLPLLLVPREG